MHAVIQSAFGMSGAAYLTPSSPGLEAQTVFQNDISTIKVKQTVQNVNLGRYNGLGI
jgi:hypothetical protein